MHCTHFYFYPSLTLTSCSHHYMFLPLAPLWSLMVKEEHWVCKGRLYIHRETLCRKINVEQVQKQPSFSVSLASHKPKWIEKVMKVKKTLPHNSCLWSASGGGGTTFIIKGSLLFICICWGMQTTQRSEGVSYLYFSHNREREIDYGTPETLCQTRTKGKSD